MMMVLIPMCVWGPAKQSRCTSLQKLNGSVLHRAEGSGRPSGSSPWRDATTRRGATSVVAAWAPGARYANAIGFTGDVVNSCCSKFGSARRRDRTHQCGRGRTWPWGRGGPVWELACLHACMNLLHGAACAFEIQAVILRAHGLESRPSSRPRRLQLQRCRESSAWRTATTRCCFVVP